jgi:hypothetical protein
MPKHKGWCAYITIPVREGNKFSLLHPQPHLALIGCKKNRLSLYLFLLYCFGVKAFAPPEDLPVIEFHPKTKKK